MTQNVTDKSDEIASREGNDAPEPLIIPQISDAEADKIITGFNQQFEEKILNKLKSPPIEINEPVSIANVIPDQPTLGPRQDSEGVDLQNYLSTIKADRPNVPFADEDSSMDLARLVARKKNV